MAGSIQSILQPITLVKVVSRIAAASNELLNIFGLQPGGKNETYQGHGREGSYQIFDASRDVGTLRAPGTAAGHVGLHPLGRVPFVYPRMHESVYLLAEYYHNLAKIGNPRERDAAAETMIAKQLEPVGQRLANFRLAMLAGLLRSQLYVQQSGDTWYFSFTASGALFQVDAFQMPSGNKDQLNMLAAGNIIDTPWSSNGADIARHLGQIDVAFQTLTGGRLEKVICPFAVWDYVTSNDSIAAKAGVASTPFEIFERKDGTNSNGLPYNSMRGRIKAFPMVDWIITNEGINLGIPGNTTHTQMVPDTAAVFVSSQADISMYLGSEPIREYDNGPETIKVGSAQWSKGSSNPTGHEIFSLDNALPVNHVPKGLAYGTVVF